MSRIEVLQGDCIDVLKTIADESIDAVVCDPPYGLGKPPPVADVLLAWLAGEPYHAKGGGFMGAKWDAFVPGPEVWRECLRVLKPGGHLLAFFGTRTYHLGATAVELAGFEVRDLIAWLYGQGFPKSRNVSKDIDKVNAESDRAHRFTSWMRTTGLTAGDINKATNTYMGSHYLTDKSQPAIPTRAIWGVLRPLCRDIPAWVDILIDRVEAEREVIGTATKARSEAGASALPTLGAKTEYKTWDITTPATPEAAQWEGWGTALKPALEPVVFARKPFKGATYRQVLATGTGAINIDGCRIGDEEISQHGRSGDSFGFTSAEPAGRTWTGRWPANVALDEEAAAMLDAQSGRLAGRGNKSPSKRVCRPDQVYAMDIQNGDCGGRLTYDKGGGASRFFYCAKANDRERSAGVGDLKTRHKTVKPIGLMRWLVRLVTPPGGTVLDPFAGSGTTGLAAQAEGFGAVLIEREPEYFELARARNANLAACLAISRIADAPTPETRQMALFR